MAHALLELGLARTPGELESALWETDFRVVQQLSHAAGAQAGRRFRWKHSGPGDPSLEARAEALKRRDWQWQSEPR